MLVGDLADAEVPEHLLVLVDLSLLEAGNSCLGMEDGDKVNELAVVCDSGRVHVDVLLQRHLRCFFARCALEEVPKRCLTLVELDELCLVLPDSVFEVDLLAHYGFTTNQGLQNALHVELLAL